MLEFVLSFLASHFPPDASAGKLFVSSFIVLSLAMSGVCLVGLVLNVVAYCAGLSYLSVEDTYRVSPGFWLIIFAIPLFNLFGLFCLCASRLWDAIDTFTAFLRTRSKRFWRRRNERRNATAPAVDGFGCGGHG